MTNVKMLLWIDSKLMNFTEPCPKGFEKVNRGNSDPVYEVQKALNRHLENLFGYEDWSDKIIVY